MAHKTSANSLIRNINRPYKSGSRIEGKDKRDISCYQLTEILAVEVLEDVEEAVEEEGVVLHQLVVLRQLRRRQHPQLRIDRCHLLQLPRHPTLPPQKPPVARLDGRTQHASFTIQERVERSRAAIQDSLYSFLFIIFIFLQVYDLIF